MKSSKVSIKTRSTPASLSFKGQATKQETVKWSIFPLHCKMNDISQDGCSSSESFLMLVVGDVTLQILGKQ